MALVIAQVVRNAPCKRCEANKDYHAFAFTTEDALSIYRALEQAGHWAATPFYESANGHGEWLSDRIDEQNAEKAATDA
jgi:hypothetical protein